MLLMLAPPGLRSPSPFEMRRSISVASSGWLATSSCPFSFSHQRKLGMPSLLPWRMPAWLAGVVEGRSASQCPSLWLPLPDPAGHGRHPTRAQRVGHHVMRQPVHLDDDEARVVGPDDVRPSARERPHERPVVGVVLAEPEEQADGPGEEAEDERDDQRTDEAAREPVRRSRNSSQA